MLDGHWLHRDAELLGHLLGVSDEPVLENVAEDVAYPIQTDSAGEEVEARDRREVFDVPVLACEVEDVCHLAGDLGSCSRAVWGAHAQAKAELVGFGEPQQLKRLLVCE